MVQNGPASASRQASARIPSAPSRPVIPPKLAGRLPVCGSTTSPSTVQSSAMPSTSMATGRHQRRPWGVSSWSASRHSLRAQA